MLLENKLVVENLSTTENNYCLYNIPRRLINDCEYGAAGIYIKFLELNNSQENKNKYSIYSFVTQTYNLETCKKLLEKLISYGFVASDGLFYSLLECNEECIKLKQFPIAIKIPSKNKSKYPDWFEKIWDIYPSRCGSNSKTSAYEQIQKRVKEGHTIDEFIYGTDLYSKYATKTNIVSTQFVMQASRFFGKSKYFLKENNCFEIEENKSTQRSATQIKIDAENFIKSTFIDPFIKRSN